MTMRSSSLGAKPCWAAFPTLLPSSSYRWKRTCIRATGWCLEIHDLVVAKMVAGREKDYDFGLAAARHGLISQAVLLERLAVTACPPAVSAAVEGRVQAMFTSTR